MNEKCFAMKTVLEGTGICVCREDKCPGYEACPFYKPAWKFERDLEKKYRRLARLPEEMQRHISYKYYRGMMPWRRDMV